MGWNKGSMGRILTPVLFMWKKAGIVIQSRRSRFLVRKTRSRYAWIGTGGGSGRGGPQGWGVSCIWMRWGREELGWVGREVSG
jgi:hypothetical protein